MTWAVGDTAIVCKAGYRAVEGSVTRVENGIVTVRRSSREHQFDAKTGLGEGGSRIITQDEMMRSQQRVKELLSDTPANATIVVKALG